MVNSRDLSNIQKAVITSVIALICAGCETERKHFKGEVPRFAQNADTELPVEVKADKQKENIIYTFHKLPPAKGKVILPDVVPEPKPYVFSEEELKRILQISRLKTMDNKLNTVNQRLQNLNNAPLPHDPGTMADIEFDTSRLEKELTELSSNRSH
jgi:hypothetical protein